MMWFFLGLAALIGIGAVAASLNLNDVKSKFANLGVLAGRSKSEIIAAVGAPNSVSAMADGKTLLQWQHISQAGGYHIALLFDANEVCEGVTHEHAS